MIQPRKKGAADEVDQDRDALRRREILDAALSCFLQFGYTKTSLEDIAKAAHLSRPLIYRKFKNKEEILKAVFENVFEGRYERAAELLESGASKRAKLLGLCELLYIEPWMRVSGTAMATELYEACNRIDGEGNERRKRRFLKCLQSVVGAKDVAEVFMLAAEGLSADVPTGNVLRRRIEVLVGRFA